MADGRYVAYYRVSTKRQGLGLEAQQAAVARYLNGGNWYVVAAFEEKESGTAKGNNRPELAKALHAARVRGCKLIVANVSRLTRSPGFLNQLLDSGVDVCFCDFPSVKGPIGRFMLQQMVNVAELEAGLIAERTSAALQVRKASGKTLGGYRGVMNVDAGTRAKAAATVRAKADRKAADIMVEITRLKGSGVTSYGALARALAAAEIATPRGGSAWTATQVQRVMARA